MLPNGDPAVIFDRAITVLLADLERAKLAVTDQPKASRPSNSRSRHIPAAVKRAVWARDTGHCAFVGAQGRCAETGLLEYHHVVPYAAGGQAQIDQIELRCRAHNQYESRLWFGPEQPWMVREAGVMWPDATGSGPSWPASTAVGLDGAFAPLLQWVPDDCGMVTGRGKKLRERARWAPRRERERLAPAGTRYDVRHAPEHNP